MMPSLNNPFQMVSAFTMPGLFHLAWPNDALVHNPGWTELAIDCRGSWSKPCWDARGTKQPWPWDLKTWQSLTHWARVLGAVRWYLLNRSTLIHNVPA